MVTAGGRARVADPPSDVSVTVSAERASEAGTLVAGLTSEDFEVTLDGHAVAVQSAVPVAASASVLLLVDLTWSTTRGDHPDEFRANHLRNGGKGAGPWMSFPGRVRGLDKALLPLLEPSDRLTVGSFAGGRHSFAKAAGPMMGDRLSAFRQAIAPQAVPLLDWYGASPIWDATAAGVAELANEPPPRAIVLVTDGSARGNRLRLTDAVLAAIARRVAVHVVCEKSWWPASAGPSGETLVRGLAEQTGGLIRIDDATDRLPWDKPARIFRDIVAAIHHSYEIRIDVGELSHGLRPLEVRVRRPNVVVHAPKWLILTDGQSKM